MEHRDIASFWLLLGQLRGTMHRIHEGHGDHKELMQDLDRNDIDIIDWLNLECAAGIVADRITYRRERNKHAC